jgi:hypothetical protein
MKKWDKGGPKSVILRCTEDFKSLVWLNTKTLQKMGAIDVCSLSKATEGTGSNHNTSRKGLLKSKIALPECCFVLETARRQLCFEAAARPQAARWVDAAQLLLEVHRATKGGMHF